MGPRLLNVRSMCLWSCLKRSSLQNFTRLTQPLFPVWGISSKLRTRPSKPLLLTSFLLSNLSASSVPAADTHRALRGGTHSRFLDPRGPCALTHTFSRVDMLLMVPTRRLSQPHPELWHPSSFLQSSLFLSSYPWLWAISLMNWLQIMIYWCGDQSSRETQQKPNVGVIQHTHTYWQIVQLAKENFIRLQATEQKKASLWSFTCWGDSSFCFLFLSIKPVATQQQKLSANKFIITRN